MKKTFKVLACIFGLGFVIMMGLQLVVEQGLNRTMREVVLPRIRKMAGIDVQVGRLSVDLANSQLILKRVEIRNPAGFPPQNLASIDRAEVSVDIASLFRHKPLLIRNIKLKGALVNVVRSRDGELNVAKLLERKPPPTASRAEAVPQPKPAPPPTSTRQTGTPAARAHPKPLPEVMVDALNCQARLRYLDLGASALDITLNLELKGKELSSLAATNTPWGALMLTGAAANNPASFVTDLKMRLAPVTNPQTVSFDLTGQMKEIDPRFMEEAGNEIGLRTAPFGLEPSLHCRDGGLENSKIALNLRDVKLEDKRARQSGGASSVDALRLVLPVTGSLKEPSINLESSLLSAIGGNARSFLGSFLEKATTKDADADETRPPHE